MRMWDLPLGRSEQTPPPTLASFAIEAVVERAESDPAGVDDVIMGAALQ